MTKETREIGEKLNEATTGMSLRDWFAGQALAGFLASYDNSGPLDVPNEAKSAYMLADAMLKEREK